MYFCQVRLHIQESSVCLVLCSVLVEWSVQWVHALRLWWRGHHSAGCGSVWTIWPTCTALIQSGGCCSFPRQPCLSFSNRESFIMGISLYRRKASEHDWEVKRMRGLPFHLRTQKNMWLRLFFRRKFNSSSLWDLLAFSLSFLLCKKKCNDTHFYKKVLCYPFLRLVVGLNEAMHVHREHSASHKESRQCLVAVLCAAVLGPP